MTKLMHYSDKPIDRLDPEFVYDWDMVRYCGWAKPVGLWISVEDGHGWKEWSVSEGFRLENLKYKHEIILKPDANILRINTHEEIMKFTEEYWWDFLKEALRMGPAVFLENNHSSWPPQDPSQRDRPSIRWDIIKQKYQGIIIAPYQWDFRLSEETRWYYGWDCSSGCIWDVSCIDEFKLIAEEDENDNG